MARTASGDVKIYQPQFQGAFIETLQQNVDAFNAASNGAIAMSTRQLKGNYEYEAFFDEVSSISRRDPTDSSSSATATKLTQDDFISVKLHRRNGPYEWNISAAALAGFDAARFSLAVGRQAAVAIPKEQLDRALAALEAKLDATAALSHDDVTATIATADLVDGLSKFGDQGSRIVAWIMHSKPFYDLVKEQIASSATPFGTMPFGATLFQGMPVTLNRPVIVVDSPSLKSEADGSSSGAPIYSTLGLVRGAAMVEMTELPLAVAEGPLTGNDNLYVRWQAEYGYNLGLKGCQYKVATGANPTDANVADGTNWTTVVADNKLLPGVIIRTQ